MPNRSDSRLLSLGYGLCAVVACSSTAAMAYVGLRLQRMGMPELFELPIARYTTSPYLPEQAFSLAASVAPSKNSVLRFTRTSSQPPVSMTTSMRTRIRTTASTTLVAHAQGIPPDAGPMTDLPPKPTSSVSRWQFPIESEAPPICKSLSSRRIATCIGPQARVYKDRRPLLVTGFGGSGTHSLVDVLKANGIRVEHETSGVDGAVSWPFAVDAAGTVTPTNNPTVKGRCGWLSPAAMLFDRVLHVVRCPLEVVSAFLSHGDCSVEYVRRHMHLNVTPGMRDSAERIRFSGAAWLTWNDHIEKYADARYRIDELAALARDACQHVVGISGSCVSMTLPVKHLNKRKHLKLSWADIRRVDAALESALREKAIEYGFGEACTDPVV